MKIHAWETGAGLQRTKVLLRAVLLLLQPISFICHTARSKPEWKRQAVITGAVKDNSVSESFWLMCKAVSGTFSICPG